MGEGELDFSPTALWYNSEQKEGLPVGVLN